MIKVSYALLLLQLMFLPRLNKALCYVSISMLRYATLRYVTVRYAMLCYVMLC